MTVITLKINEKNQEAKALLDYLKKLPFVEVEKKHKEKGLYNPEFVEMIKKSAASKKRYVVNNVDELWESL